MFGKKEARGFTVLPYASGINADQTSGHFPDSHLLPGRPCSDNVVKSSISSGIPASPLGEAAGTWGELSLLRLMRPGGAAFVANCKPDLPRGGFRFGS